jgi:pyrroloquinoline-quinone synthase
LTPELLNSDALEQALRQIGAERYHSLHPFHRLLHDGKLNRGQVQVWALNRYYYQAAIPVKDSWLMARLGTSELRREWRRRIEDHDGCTGRDGNPMGSGIERWLKLAEGVGLDREMVIRADQILPETRFAVDAYIHFVRDRSVLEAVASSLTELFSPTIISERVSGMLAHYDWINRDTLAYFTPRLTQAPQDADFALAYVKHHADTVEKQQAVLGALRFKCDVLWSQLNGLYLAYVSPGMIPPGCFVPAPERAREPAGA